MISESNQDEVTPFQSNELKQWFTDHQISLSGKLAVAVSGGADSLCLALLTNQIADIAALIVDHGLRPESTTEANAVQQQLIQRGIEAEVLTWRAEEKPTSNIQAAAREARYKLMVDWCLANDVQYLLVAHHQDDQAETVLLRLCRGSGLSGLAGMEPIRKLTSGVILVRPLLDVPKAKLVKTLQDIGANWVEDPSNQNADFDRIKARTMLKQPPLAGLTADRLTNTAAHLARAQQAIDHYVAVWLEGAVAFHEAGYAEINTVAMESVPEEISLRGLANILRFASGAEYSPRFEKLYRLWQTLQEPDFAGATLSGARLLQEKGGLVIVQREKAVAEDEVSVENQTVWDGRFQVWADTSAENQELRIGALDDRLIKDLREDNSVQTDIPVSVWPVLPAFYRRGALIAVPHLGYATSKHNLPNLTHLWLASSENGKKIYRDVQ